MDLVIEDGSRVGTVYFLMNEDNVKREVGLPWMSFGSDEASEAPEGVFLKSSSHPRAYGNVARVLGQYVRDENAATLPGRDPPPDVASRDQSRHPASAAGSSPAITPTSWCSIPRRSRTTRPSKSRSSSRPASTTCSSTASRCSRTASTPAPSRAASCAVPAGPAGRAEARAIGLMSAVGGKRTLGRDGVGANWRGLQASSTTALQFSSFTSTAIAVPGFQRFSDDRGSAVLYALTRQFCRLGELGRRCESLADPSGSPRFGPDTVLRMSGAAWSSNAIASRKSALAGQKYRRDPFGLRAINR